MALRLLWLPSTSSTEQNQQFLSLYKPSHTSFSSLLSLFPISSISISHSSTISTTKRKTNLLIFQVSSTSELPSSPSSSSATIDTIEPPTEEVEEVSKTRLIARNVPWNSTTEDIQNLFQKHGKVLNVELSMYNKVRNRGLAFVTMASEEEALEALTKLDSNEFEGRTINVAYAKARKKKSLPEVPVPVQKYDVFVANLSWKVKSKDLMAFFSSMSDDLISSDITYQTSPARKPTGYGFVSFRSKEKAVEAITSFQGKVLMGKPVRLAYSNRSLKAESKDSTSLGEPSVEVSADEGESKDITNVGESSVEVNADEGISDNADETNT